MGLYGNKFLAERVSLSYDDFIDIYYDAVNESKYLIESMVNESVDLSKVKDNIISTINKLFNGFVKFVSDMFTKLIDFIQNSYNELSKKVNMKLYKDIQFKDIQTAYENGFVSETTEAIFLKPEFEIDFIDDSKSSFNEILKKVDNNIEKIFSSFTYDGYNVDLYDDTREELLDINKKISEISHININVSGFAKADIIKNKSGETEVQLTEETFDIVKKFVFDYRILCKKYKDYSNSIIKDMKSKKDKLESDLKKNKNILKNKNIDDAEKENKIVNNLYTLLYIDRYQTEIKYRLELAKWYIKYVKSWHKRSMSIYKECIKAVKQYVSSNNDKSSD